MGWLLDKQGRIKGTRWNIVDFLAVVLVFCFCLGGYFAYKILNREAPLSPPKMFYKKSYSCPVCGLSNVLVIDRGTLPEDTYTWICRRCENEVRWSNTDLQPAPPDYVTMYYKLLYEKHKQKLEGGGE